MKIKEWLNNYKIKKYESQFRKLGLDDKLWVEKACNEDQGYGSDICFFYMLVLQETFEADKYAKGPGGCIIKFPWGSDGVLHVRYPVGKSENRIQAVKELVELYTPVYEKIEFFGLNEENLAELQGIYGENVVDTRMESSMQCFIYNVKEHIALEGSRYASIRRKLRNFDKQYNWTYEEITKENLQECMEINSSWVDIHEKSQGVELDQNAINRAFELFDEFGFKGGMIRVDGKAVAFNLGFPLHQDCFIGLLAKADNSYQNSSIFMIHEFIKHVCPEYKHFNFTEDAESPGLRKFKMDMQPEFLTSWYYAVVKTRIS